MHSILVSDRGSLRVGRSLTTTVESKWKRANVSRPAHCTDILLVSAASRAEQGKDTQTQGEEESEREILHSQGAQDGWRIEG